MDNPPHYANPGEFLNGLARRLHTIPERVPHERALEELIRWMEASAAAGEPPPIAFLQVALRLFYEHNRLRSKPSGGDLFTIVDRLREANQGRPQAGRWRGADWLKLARLLLEQRKLPLVELFGLRGNPPPSPQGLIRTMPLPYFARHVEKPLHPDAKRIPTTSLESLFERAEQLLAAAQRDVEDARHIFFKGERPPHKPPGRTNAAQEFARSMQKSQ
jgi:hypothetical protein